MSAIKMRKLELTDNELLKSYIWISPSFLTRKSFKGTVVDRTERIKKKGFLIFEITKVRLFFVIPEP